MHQATIDVDPLGSHLVVRARPGGRLAEAWMPADAIAAPGRTACHLPALPSLVAGVRELAAAPQVTVRPAAERLIRSVVDLPATSRAVALPCEHAPGREGVIVPAARSVHPHGPLSQIPGVRYDADLHRWWLPARRESLDALGEILDSQPDVTALAAVRQLVAPLVQASLSAHAVADLEHRCVVELTRGPTAEAQLRLCRRCHPALDADLRDLTESVTRSFDSWWVRLDGRSDGDLTAFLRDRPELEAGADVLAEIAHAAQSARAVETIEALSAAASAPPGGPDVLDALHAFQRVSVHYALRQRRTFLADEPGLGKTVQALATIEAADGFPALVACPASLRLNWLREAAQWLPHRTAALLNPEAAGALPDLAVASYDVLHRVAERPPGDGVRALVLDEAHLCKNAAARRTQAAAAIAGRLDPDALVLLLTGTPVLNRPSELVSQLEILGRVDDVGGRRFLTRLDQDGRELGALHRRLRRTCYVRRRKADVLEQLPEKQRVVVPVELTNRAEYERVKTDVAAWLREQAEEDAREAAALEGLAGTELSDAITARGRAVERRTRSAEALVRLTHLGLVAARGKVRMATEWIESFLESGEKLVVFCRHREIAAVLGKAFPDAATATGELDADRRSGEVARFQEDPACRLIVCTLAAAGVGLTMTAASNVAFVELGWTPAVHDQAEDRVHRIGQTSSVTAWYLLAADTIDERIAEVLERKRRLIDATSDGADLDEASTLRELTDWLVAMDDAVPAPAAGR
jgi:hypothetical protein